MKNAIYAPQTFSADTGVSLKLAKRILDVLYTKELNAQDLNAVIWRLRDWMMRQEDMAKLLEKQDDEVIEGIVDEMIRERTMYDCPKQVCCAETGEQLSRAMKAHDARTRTWFFTALDFKEKKGDFREGDVVTIQIMRTGKWNHPMYGEVKITKSTIDDVITNFREKKRGIDLAVDENHEENHKALGWFREVFSDDEGENCFAKIELTKRGAELLNEGAYKYFSPEIVFAKEDEETGEQHSNLLIGGAFTNRPFFKAMQPLMASETATNDVPANDPKAGQLLFVSLSERMKEFLELLAKFGEASAVSSDDVRQLRAAYDSVPKEHHNQAFDEQVASVEKKADGEGGEETPVPAAPSEGGDGAETPATQPEEPAAPAAEGEAMQASENADGTFTVSAAFMEKVRKDRIAKRFSETLDKLSPFRFNEKNKNGFILPKDAQEFAEFVCGFSDAQVEKMVGFLGKFKVIGAELGRAPKGDGVSVKLTEADPMVQHYMKQFGQSAEQAIQSAEQYYKIAKK